MIVELNPDGKRTPYDYFKEDEDAQVEAPYLDEEEEALQIEQLGQIPARPSDFVEFSVYMPVKGGLRPFSFESREYLRPIYDSPAPRKLLMAGRQVEKTLVLQALVSLEDGSLKTAEEVRVGESLASMNLANGGRSDMGAVTWKSKVYIKPCLTLRTRQGHEVIVAITHPMRRWDEWVEASKLRVGDRIAVVRRCGEFTGRVDVSWERVSLTAYLIGDGHIGRYISFTALPGPQLDDFLKCVYDSGGTARTSVKKDSRAKTALFLNRLWSTDGHVKKNSKSKYSIEYCSMSPTLIRQVQALLWKFGVPSRIRENWPNYWKKRGIDKRAHILRVETQEGVRIFLEEIGALGKSENTSLPEGPSSNNRDTYPKEINSLIKAILSSRGRDDWHENRDGDSLHQIGLRRSLKYAPTRDKLALYVDFFRMDERFDQELVDQLAAHLNTDIYWDTITEIEDVGEQSCVDFRVDPYHSFIADGFITHNSTYLGNTILAYSAMNPFFKSIYVSPSNQQTKVFSRDRLKEPMEISPVLRHYSNTRLLQNVLEKKFVNQSQVTLRFAFLNVDRVRGLPGDYINIDELQDIILENIPVIEECASHSEFKWFTYSGTPKSLDNAIEHYWSRYSTQNEWIVPCRRHGTPKDKGSWHWNVLSESNIGKDSLVCDKCGEPISPADPDCQWASMNPEPSVEKPFEGYRLPQLMVPWIDIADIKDKQIKYSRAKFYNEVLGRSYDSGTRPLTRRDMQRNCWNELSMMHYRDVIKFTQQWPVFAGVDWGCHDDQTRILTERGFVHFEDLGPEDRVAQFDQTTKVMSFVKPTAITKKKWDGPLYHVKRKSADMAVTPDHRMLVRKTWGRKEWEVMEAQEAFSYGASLEFVDRVVWEGKEQREFTIPEVPKSAGYSGCDPITMPMDEWLEFLGYLLSEGGLCWRKVKEGSTSPSCIKMSQRETVNPKDTRKIRECLRRLPFKVSEFPNKKTGDVNWSIYGKQLWSWVWKEVGESCHTKRIHREFLSLSPRQLKILFDAMTLGDGSVDKRGRNSNGCYSSTSKGLCEDYQELCVKLGLRSTLRLSRGAEGNKKAKWVTSWSFGSTFTLNTPNTVETISYKGNVYCCTVPNGFIVTERNGRIAYQGNSGEGSFTVMTLGGYLPFAKEKFTIFYAKRFEGLESEPDVQLQEIKRYIRDFNVQYVGVDYGGGFWPNDKLVRWYGAEKIKKYQWVGQVKKKVTFEGRLGVPRFLCHRTEVMSDMFNAIKRANVFRFPRWEEWEDPFAQDFLNIYSEYNERLRMNVYKHAQGSPDDTFHSMVYCFLASFFYKPRADVILPEKEVDREQQAYDLEDLDVV